MNRFIPEIKTLIKSFDKKQNKLLKETMNGKFDKSTVNYGTLGIALGSNLREYSAKQIKTYYKVNNLKQLVPSDIMLAIIIMTLTDITGADVRAVFEEISTQDPTQPELVFLANLVYKVTQEAIVATK